MGILGIFAFLKCLNVGFFSNDETIDSGRFQLWKESLIIAFKNPFFGGGFFVEGGLAPANLSSVLPSFSHNTFVQMISSCGIFGFLSYVFYRIATFNAIRKNYKKERWYVLISLLLFLLLSLLDIHLFNLLGTAIYIMLFSMCVENNLCLDKKIVY